MQANALLEERVKTLLPKRQVTGQSSGRSGEKDALSALGFWRMRGLHLPF